MKTTEDKIYHIYMNGSCVYHNLRKEEFSYLWGLLKHISSNVQDVNLEYEELSEDMKTVMASY